MRSTCCNCDARVWAVALGRWCLGVLFLFFGIGKLGNIAGFAQNYLAPAFAKTWLPKWLVLGFGYTLPFAETLLGILLLLGLARNPVLFATGLLLIALTFGQVLLQAPPVVFSNTVYTFLTAGLLFLGEHDRWVLFRRRAGTETGGKG